MGHSQTHSLHQPTSNARIDATTVQNGLKVATADRGGLKHQSLRQPRSQITIQTASHLMNAAIQEWRANSQSANGRATNRRTQERNYESQRVNARSESASQNLNRPTKQSAHRRMRRCANQGGADRGNESIRADINDTARASANPPAKPVGALKTVRPVEALTR